MTSLHPNPNFIQVSSFLDGSTIYGSSKMKALSLRSMKNGQLRSIKLSSNFHSFFIDFECRLFIHYLSTCFFFFTETEKSKGLLPIQDENSQDCKMSGNQKCFKSGDDRFLSFTFILFEICKLNYPVRWSLINLLINSYLFFRCSLSE